jgi:phosphoglycerol transferase
LYVNVFISAAVSLGTLLVLSGLVVAREFGTVTLNSILFHLEVLNETVPEFVTADLLYQVLVESLYPSLALGTALVFLLQGIRTSQAQKLVALLVSISYLAASFYYFDSRVNVTDYLSSLTRQSSFDQFYVEPTFRNSGEKSNLVLIYLESIEKSYMDSGIYGENLIKELDEATQGPAWLEIQSVSQKLPGTGWTIAALVATQCGIPLIGTGLSGGNASLEEVSKFLPNASCLGDILSDAGYRNVFMGGASTNFAAKGRFLSDHGFDEIYGREEWVEMGVDEEEMHVWGLRDSQLLDFALAKHQSLVSEGEPFSLVVLTVDSHRPGLPNPNCASTRSDNQERSIVCSTESVAKFIRGIDDYPNTTIVVIGDHASMGPNISEASNDKSSDSVFFRIRPPLEVEKELFPGMLPSLPFDVFPTVLESIGFDVQSERAGLGVSVFDQKNSVLSQMSLKGLRESLGAPSKTYWLLW